MELRRRKVEWVGADGLPDAGSSATDSLHDREALMELLHQLPDGYRTVFNLYALEGYSHAEIAEQLGISEATSKSQLSRARQWMQRRLANFDLQ
jgi:RNA polymerase sigma-70 factor (ECF subfamily)